MVDLDKGLALNLVWMYTLFHIKKAMDNDKYPTTKNIFKEVVDEIKTYITIKRGTPISI